MLTGPKKKLHICGDLCFLPIIVFGRQNQHCCIGAVVGFESKSVETGSMRWVDHEVNDEKWVKRKGRKDNQSAKPGDVSTDHVSQWF